MIWKILPIMIAELALVTVMIAGALTAGEIARRDTRAEMQAVETLLVFHGIDVKGFADTDPIDVNPIVAIAPANCRDVMRTAWLARIAVARMQPDRSLADARIIAKGAAAIVAQEFGHEECIAR